MCTNGILGVYITDKTVNSETFCALIKQCLLPYLLPFNGVNLQSVVIIGNAFIHHTNSVVSLIEACYGMSLARQNVMWLAWHVSGKAHVVLVGMAQVDSSGNGACRQGHGPHTVDSFVSPARHSVVHLVSAGRQTQPCLDHMVWYPYLFTH